MVLFQNHFQAVVETKDHALFSPGCRRWLRHPGSTGRPFVTTADGSQESAREDS